MSLSYNDGSLSWLCSDGINWLDVNNRVDIRYVTVVVRCYSIDVTCLWSHKFSACLATTLMDKSEIIDVDIWVNVYCQERGREREEQERTMSDIRIKRNSWYNIATLHRSLSSWSTIQFGHFYNRTTSSGIVPSRSVGKISLTLRVNWLHKFGCPNILSNTERFRCNRE